MSVCSSQSLRFWRDETVRTVDMVFSFAVLAAPTIRAARAVPRSQSAAERPAHGRAAEKDGKGKSATVRTGAPAQSRGDRAENRNAKDSGRDGVSTPAMTSDVLRA